MSRESILKEISFFLEKKFQEPILFYKKNEDNSNYELTLSTYNEFEDSRKFNDVKFKSDLLSVSDLALFIKSQNKNKDTFSRINFFLNKEKDSMFMGNFSTDRKNIKKIISMFNNLNKNGIVQSVSENNKPENTNRPINNI